jgi:hypothetical protein
MHKLNPTSASMTATLTATNQIRLSPPVKAQKTYGRSALSPGFAQRADVSRDVLSFFGTGTR